MADNSVKYEEIENVQKSVQDDTEFAYASRPRYNSSVEAVELVDTPELPSYTMEELNARIDEAEEQIARGEVISAEEADREIEKMFSLWS